MYLKLKLSLNKLLKKINIRMGCASSRAVDDVNSSKFFYLFEKLKQFYQSLKKNVNKRRLIETVTGKVYLKES